jgi:hypothetical protein
MEKMSIEQERDVIIRKAAVSEEIEDLERIFQGVACLSAAATEHAPEGDALNSAMRHAEALRANLKEMLLEKYREFWKLSGACEG